MLFESTYPPCNWCNAKFDVFQTPTHYVIKSNDSNSTISRTDQSSWSFFRWALLFSAKLKKLRLHLAKKKRRAQNKKQKSKFQLYFSSAISKSVLQFVLLKLYQHCLLTQNNEIVLYRKRSDEKTTKAVCFSPPTLGGFPPTFYFPKNPPTSWGVFLCIKFWKSPD